MGSLLFTVAAFLLIDRNIISRITALSKSVLNLRVKGTLADRVQADGNDEIGSLASEINQMLQTLEASDQDLRLYKDELEKLVEDRTEKYTQANLDLKREIEEREQGQQALLAAYNENQMIISSISSIMVGVDDNHKVTLWNNVATRLLGVNKNDAIGKDFFSLAIAWDWTQLASDVDKCTGQTVQVRMNDILLGLPDQNKRILGITLSPLILKDRERPGFLLIGSDITERRRLEEKLDRSSKLEAIGQLAAGVAHEINTPTQLIGSNLRFLGQQIEPVLTLIDKAYALNEDVKNGIATPDAAYQLEEAALAAHINFFRQESPKAIEQSLVGIERITHIVSAMRFFSHPGSETKEIANLNRIIESALSLSRNEWKNLADIQLDLDPDLPALECLPIDLSQVVLNLVINAVHAIQDVSAEREDYSGQITISSRKVDDLLEMRIIDNGIGIPKEIRNKIFDLFFTTKDVGRGTGQGLAIAYNVVVKKHGGSIEFESEVGKGTTFMIRLPRTAYDD
jgi:PAS domain S-box-containing protein